ncbi:alpha/beta fold hydrolase [Catellatospora sp. KI3]|uniref:thioesterase II family protein n=1 Tax=Catellatospora sp. KI3 TaxID=3041620 RepID=UPI002482FAB0|nr:alpha/beta fold hydrolase [Catellatospora sp. KI3]MDI1463731.1 alpha/beta fold hydrolase [Catellatospora sp. KI3]
MNPNTPTRTARAHGWIVGAPRRTTPSVRLFCLPHAGGSSSAYAGWPALFGPEVEVCPIELPGRHTRWHEPAVTDVDTLVNALATALAGELDVPYALFGHSMGSLLAFELARTLRRRGYGEPRVLFASGGPAPHLRREQPLHDKPDPELIERLAAYGGLPDELLAEPELLELLLPIIRADFQLCETYRHRAEAPLACPIVAYAGEQDAEVPLARVRPWQEHTSGPFTQHVLPGGHFFVRSDQDTVLASVRAALADAGAPTAA